jgi:hypothetical protein
MNNNITKTEINNNIKANKNSKKQRTATTRTTSNTIKASTTRKITINTRNGKTMNNTKKWKMMTINNNTSFR